MDKYFELVLACRIRKTVSNEIMETLTYMTRFEDYEFDTDIDNLLFSDETCWRSIFRNAPRRGEEHLPGVFGVIFSNFDLSVRQCTNEDEFWNTWIYLGDWLASICEPTGFVGYYKNLIEWEPTLIYFKKEGVEVV